MPQNEENLSKGSEEEQNKLADLISKVFGQPANEINLSEQKSAKIETTESYPKRVKEIRMFVDHLLIQSKKISSTREISLAYTNMQRGFMWLGMVLADIKEPNPYPESTNISSPKIEERTDQAKDIPATFEGCPDVLDRTVCVKWFRLQLDNVLDKIDFPLACHDSQLALNAFKEAKMWFGQELNNIRLAESVQ